MTTEKKFIARSFYFLLYHFIRSKYNHTEIVFVSHDTVGYEVNEDQFFTRGNSGGTKVSSGLLLVDEIIQQALTAKIESIEWSKEDVEAHDQSIIGTNDKNIPSIAH